MSKGPEARTIERLTQRFNKFDDARELGSAFLTLFEQAEAKKEMAEDILHSLAIEVPDGYRAVAHAPRGGWLEVEHWVGLYDGLAAPIRWSPGITEWAMWRLRNGRVRRFFVGQLIEGKSLDTTAVPTGYIYDATDIRDSEFRAILTPEVTVEFMTDEEVQERFVAPKLPYERRQRQHEHAR